MVLSIPNLEGFNVTIPFKEEILKYVAALSDEAKAIGAVNVVKIINFNNEVKLYGDNTDWRGFRDSLISLGDCKGKKALILGTGGASKAVRYALDTLAIPYKLVSRDATKGDFTYSELSGEVFSEYDVIINTTPLGTYPEIEAYPPIPYHYLTPKHICYDLVYNPDVTEFMRRSSAFGAIVKNGLEMLHRQADYAWEIWRNY